MTRSALNDDVARSFLLERFDDYLALEQGNRRSVERADQGEPLDPVPPVAEDGEVNVWGVDGVLHPVPSIPISPIVGKVSSSDRRLGFASGSRVLELPRPAR